MIIPAFYRIARQIGASLVVFLGLTLSVWAADTGTQQWTYQLDGNVYSVSISPSGGTVYAGSVDNEFYALNDDGTLKWTYQTGGEIYSVPAVADDGTIYFGSYDQNLYALNADGTLKWTYQTGDEIHASPAIADDGTVYVGSHDQNLYAMNADGTLKWQYQTGSVIRSRPAVDTDGTIYFGSNDSTLYALNADGTLKWSYATGGAVKSSPAVDTAAKVVYVGSNDTYLYAVNTDDGSLKWQYQTGDQVASSPVVATDGTVYVGSNDAYVYAVNPDGTLKWQYQTGGSADLALKLTDLGWVVVASDHDTLNILEPLSGTLSWSFKADANISSDPVVDGDLIYFGAKDEQVYAVEAPASASVTQVTLVSPVDNAVLDYAGTSGQIAFTFEDVSKADTYTLHILVTDVLGGTDIPVAFPLVPGQTSGFTQSGSQWSYELILDQSQWETMAVFDLAWGVEALDSQGNVLVSSMVSGTADPYAFGLKLAAAFGITLTTPSFGADLDFADPTPSFTWDDYAGVDTYTLILGHYENGGFDNFLIKDSLTASPHTPGDSQWQSLPGGTWYWTVLGYNKVGSNTPPGFTLMKFILSGQPTTTGFSVSQSTVTLHVGDSQDLTVSNGSGFYNVDISDDTVVSAVFSGDTVTVTALLAGTTDITITDSNNNTATVSVTVN